jgi:hypothetical protein
MLKCVTSTSNSFPTNLTISSRRIQGFKASWSHKAASITGVIVEGQPAPFEGAFDDP